LTSDADDMSIVYFDSGAFVKLIVDEDGSELAAALWDGADAAVSSRLAYPEVCAVLAAAQRARRLGRRGHRRAVGPGTNSGRRFGRSS
jgi:predicted nucleic acid-binding protein